MNGLNSTAKRHRLVEWIKKQNPLLQVSNCRPCGWTPGAMICTQLIFFQLRDFSLHEVRLSFLRAFTFHVCCNCFFSVLCCPVYQGAAAVQGHACRCPPNYTSHPDIEATVCPPHSYTLRYRSHLQPHTGGGYGACRGPLQFFPIWFLKLFLCAWHLRLVSYMVCIFPSLYF